MGCQEEILIEKICDLYDQISKLETLKPSKDVDMLFSQLVSTCIPPCPIDITKLTKKVQETRSNLIRLCGQAEGHLETHFSSILAEFQYPFHHFDIFPYYNNYLKLSKLEYDILAQHSTKSPKNVAFIGSGPLPFTSIVLASNHLKTTCFHNYDIDAEANSLATKLVASDPDLSDRMFFHTSDVMDVTSELQDYDVVFLAALVGMDKEEKVKIIDHLAKYMSPNATLMLRSAHGARAFLYPVVDPSDLRGFEVLSVYHPTDEVINSVVISRKICASKNLMGETMFKCCSDEIQCFNPLGHGNLIEELAIEEQIS